MQIIILSLSSQIAVNIIILQSIDFLLPIVMNCCLFFVVSFLLCSTLKVKYSIWFFFIAQVYDIHSMYRHKLQSEIDKSLLYVPYSTCCIQNEVITITIIHVYM